MICDSLLWISLGDIVLILMHCWTWTLHTSPYYCISYAYTIWFTWCGNNPLVKCFRQFSLSRANYLPPFGSSTFVFLAYRITDVEHVHSKQQHQKLNVHFLRSKRVRLQQLQSVLPYDRITSPMCDVLWRLSHKDMMLVTNPRNGRRKFPLMRSATFHYLEMLFHVLASV